MLFGQRIPRMGLRHLLINTCRLYALTDDVAFDVSLPKIKTDKAFDLKNCSFREIWDIFQ